MTLPGERVDLPLEETKAAKYLKDLTEFVKEMRELPSVMALPQQYYRGINHILHLRALEKAHVRAKRREKYHKALIKKLFNVVRFEHTRAIANNIINEARKEVYGVDAILMKDDEEVPWLR
jgi:hypothetical protein